MGHPAECHVAFVGVDNLAACRLTSDAGWTLATDIGLRDRPDTLDSVLLGRFPGPQRSGQITAWQTALRAITVPATSAFTDLEARHGQCGVTDLAGKAVGAAFTGITAACLAVAEATRELHGGTGRDCLMLSLAFMPIQDAPAGQPAGSPARHCGLKHEGASGMTKSTTPCVFCGSTGTLSTEHVIPRWLRNALVITGPVKQYTGTAYTGAAETLSVVFLRCAGRVTADGWHAWRPPCARRSSPCS